MLTRKNDLTLDFDFAKVIDQSRDNLVLYVQYGHARAQSVLRRARAEFSDLSVSWRISRWLTWHRCRIRRSCR